MKTHQKSGFHLSGDPSKGVDFALVETSQTSGFRLGKDRSKKVDFTLVGPIKRVDFILVAWRPK